jgi:AcrR family transcriptional regulator
MNLETIIAAATGQARKYGVDRITRDLVAQRAKCSPALVSHYAGSMDEVKAAVVQVAIDTGDLQILANVLADKKYKIPADLRTAAAQYLARG